MFKSQGGFANFWHYHKLKVLGVVALVAFIIFAVSQCSYGEVTDLGILHVSEVRNVNGDAFIEKLGDEAELDFAGEKPELEFVPVYVPKDPRDIMETGTLEKMQVELVSGSCTLFILDEESVYSYKDDEIFYDLTAIADKHGIAQDARYMSSDGKVLAISVDGNAYLESCPLECGSLYIAVREHGNDDAEIYKNAFAALEYIISNR